MSFITLTAKHKQRLVVILLILLGAGATVALAISAFRENMLFFFSPSQIVAGEAPQGRSIRVGGLVTAGSVRRSTVDLQVDFMVTDMQHSLSVRYTGILPDLFREGQGIVAIGQLGGDGVFVASEVLAKHDENYMPPEVHDALKQGQAMKANESGQHSN